MWVQIGNAVMVPATFFEDFDDKSYMLSWGERPFYGLWHIVQTKPHDPANPYPLVFQSVNYWVDIDQIEQFMPDTYKALMACAPTREQYEEEKVKIAKKTG